MTDEAKRLLNELKKLSVQERADIAAALLADLDGDPEHEVQAAWATEVARRASKALAGEPGIPWQDVEEGIRRQLGRA